MTAETSNARGEWVLVPRELTQGMRSALARAVNASCNTDEWYAHTLAAAPQPPIAPVGVEKVKKALERLDRTIEACAKLTQLLGDGQPHSDLISTAGGQAALAKEAIQRALAQRPAAPSGERGDELRIAALPSDVAHEIWAAAQLAPGEGIVDGAARVEALLSSYGRPAAVDEADTLLRDLVEALDAAFISSWQSTAAWQKQLDAAREYLAAQHQEPKS